MTVTTGGTDERVYALVGKLCPDGERDVSLTDRIVDDLGYHSVRIVELTIELETEFGVSLSDDVVAGLTTAGELACVVRELVAQAA